LQAKKLAEEEGRPGDKTLGEQAVRQELESLYSTLAAGSRGVDPEDLK